MIDSYVTITKDSYNENFTILLGTGTITASITVGTSSGYNVTEVDLIQNSAHIELKSYDPVNYYNQISAYGYNDWAVNVQKDFSGRSKDSLSPAHWVNGTIIPSFTQMGVTTLTIVSPESPTIVRPGSISDPGALTLTKQI